MTNDNLRDCCQTPEYAIHDQRCPIIVGPHARSHTAHTGDGNRNITSTVYCMCGSSFTADDERDARDAHTRHAVDHTNSEPVCGHGNPPDNCGQTLAPRCQPATDVFDATTPPGVTQLPAVTTSMTPAQFKEWLAADGTLFMVILPANRTFVIKVPTAHHEFFVAMMQQVRFALGPEVQAVRMNMVTAPGADVDAATGKADDAPQWAQPAPGEHLPDWMHQEARYDHEPPPPTDHLCAHHIPRGDCTTCGPNRPEPATEHLKTSPNECPICDAQPGHHCTDPDGEPLRLLPSGTSTTHNARNMVAGPAAEGNDPPTHCPHGVRLGIGRYCADCDTSPVKYGPGAIPPNPIKPLPRGDGPAFA